MNAAPVTSHEQPTDGIRGHATFTVRQGGPFFVSTIESLPASLSAFSQRLVPQIEQSLDAYTALGIDCPTTLQEAMRYSLLAPGKRLRPMLALMASEACGGSLRQAMPVACAVEMIHTYSLIHDDLPAMDNDDMRRGRPTNHKVFGEAMAILAGDALLTLAFEVVARDVHPSERAVACCGELAAAAGAAALVGGQVDDLAGEGKLAANKGGGEGEALVRLESMHRRKTGAMFLASLRMGAITAGAEPRQLDALSDYGRNLGLAFQITDDLLDVQGSELEAGKRVGKDANRGKLTFPALLGVAESRRRADCLVAAAASAISGLGLQADGLSALARFVLERNH